MNIMDLDPEGQKAIDENARLNSISIEEIQQKGVDMNGYVIGATLGEAVIPTMICAALCMAVVSKKNSVPLGWVRGLSVLLVAILIAAVGNIIVYEIFPEAFGSDEFTYLTIFQVLLIPLTASLISLFAFNRKAKTK